MISGMAMSLSSVSVVVSSLLLRMYKRPILDIQGAIIATESIEDLYEDSEKALLVTDTDDLTLLEQGHILSDDLGNPILNSPKITTQIKQLLQKKTYR